jgi:hypothetical protein
MGSHRFEPELGELRNDRGEASHVDSLLRQLRDADAGEEGPAAERGRIRDFACDEHTLDLGLDDFTAEDRELDPPTRTSGVRTYAFSALGAGGAVALALVLHSLAASPVGSTSSPSAPTPRVRTDAAEPARAAQATPSSSAVSGRRHAPTRRVPDRTGAGTQAPRADGRQSAAAEDAFRVVATGWHPTAAAPGEFGFER